MRHPATGQWWQYDDERVVLLGAHPLGDAAAAGATPGKGKGGDKADKADKAGKGKGGDKGEAARGAGRGKGAPQPPPSPPAAAPAAAAAANGVPEGHLVSADAYLLLYTRRSAASAAAEPQLPPDLAAAIAADNESAAAGMRARETASAEVRSRVTRRQNEVRAVLAAAEPRLGDDTDLRWISADWLANWSSTECVAAAALSSRMSHDTSLTLIILSFALQQPSGPD